MLINMLSTIRAVSLIIIISLKASTEGKVGSSFTSLTEMEYLVETEEALLKDLDVYIEEEKDYLDVIERYLNRSKIEHFRAAQDIEEYLSNPINAFTLIKRLTIELTNLELFIKERKGLKKNMLMKYPSEDALARSARGLVGLQVTYDLNITDMAEGILSYSQDNHTYVEFTTPMTASECYELGLVPAEDQGYTRKIFWMTEALNKRTADNCTFCFVKELAVIDHISNGYYQMGNYEYTIKWIEKRESLRPESTETIKQVKFKKKLQKLLRQRQISNTTHQANRADKDPRRKLSRNELSHSMCHQKIYVRSEVGKKLKCGYIYGPHPFLRLARAKIEMLHLNPVVMLFHDVLSDTEIRILQHLARPKLWRDRVNGQEPSIDFRHASAAHLDERVEYVFKITRRVAIFTGLNMRRSEPLKVINYGIGGQDIPHYDFHPNNTALQHQFLIKGDRLATVALFMSKIELGGATVFSKLGLKVQPVKGSALFWFNLHPSGDGDYLTLHETCPVLRGSMWLAVKWARENDQKYCSIWRTPKGIVTEEEYLKLNLREPFRDERFVKKPESVFKPAWQTTKPKIQ